MAKTVFTDGNPELEILGTPIMGAFLNAIFHTGGGHVHDGGDEDGHASLISFPNLGGMDAGSSHQRKGHGQEVGFDGIPCLLPEKTLGGYVQ